MDNNIVQDCVLGTLMGLTVTLKLLEKEPFLALIRQADKFTIIVQNVETGEHLLIYKQYVQSFHLPDATLPVLLTRITDATKKIQYKASQKRTTNSKLAHLEGKTLAKPVQTRTGASTPVITLKKRKHFDSE